MSSKPVAIFDIKFPTEDQSSIFNDIEDRIAHDRETFIVTANPEILLKTIKNHEYKKILSRANIILPDGAGIQWAANFLHDNIAIKRTRFGNLLFFLITTPASLVHFAFSKKFQTKTIKKRITGVDSISHIAKYAAKHNKSIFLLGSKEGIAKKAAENLVSKYPNLKIAGTLAGSPRKEEEAQIINEINNSNTDILLVAFGAPKQEEWLFKNKYNLKPNFLMGVGGSFDFISKEIARAPQGMRTKFEWLWRLAKEPKKRWKRIINAVIVFPYFVALEKVYKHRPFRPNVLAVVLNSKKEFLVLNNSYLSRRHNEKAHWQFLQGGKRPYEDDKKALFREIKEEMGSNKVEIIQQSGIDYSYLWPLAGLRLKRPYKGQKQTIWYVKYTGDGSDIKVDPAEHSDYKWIEKQDLFDIIHPVRSEVTQLILEEMLQKKILNKIS